MSFRIPIEVKTSKAKNRARAKKMMVRLGLTTTTKEGTKVYSKIFEHIRAGVSDESIFVIINSAMVEQARQAAEKIQKKQEAARIESARNSNYCKALHGLGITKTMHRGKEILAMAKEFAQHDFTYVEIVERLKDHPTVVESIQVQNDEREAFRRTSEEKQAEHLRHRVNMIDVVRYYAEKNGKAFLPPIAPAPARVQEAPRHVPGSSETRPLGGSESSQKENPRTYDLPNLPIHDSGMNRDRMTDARTLAGVHFPEFLKYHIKHKMNGLDAYSQAVNFMAEFYPATVTPAPANDPVIPPGDRNATEEPTLAVVATEPVKRTWTKEDKQEARDRAQAAAREALEQKDPQHIIDPVIVNGVEYRSTWQAMQTLAIGGDADARRFRREVKAKGEEIWTHDGQQYRFELKNKRPEQLEAIRKEEHELIDVELQSSGRVAEVFQRDPRAQAVFRKLVLENFGERCAVTGKHLGGVLEAAHIEGAAVDGCYNASNGVLLAPTFHKLYDRHLMGINPDTLTVHFAPGIEWEEYEGRVITPLVYRLDTDRLAARWAQFKGKK